MALASIALQAKDEDQARRLLAEALERNPGHLEGSVMLASLEIAAASRQTQSPR